MHCAVFQSSLSTHHIFFIIWVIRSVSDHLWPLHRTDELIRNMPSPNHRNSVVHNFWHDLTQFLQSMHQFQPSNHSFSNQYCPASESIQSILHIVRFLQLCNWLYPTLSSQGKHLEAFGVWAMDPSTVYSCKSYFHILKQEEILLEDSFWKSKVPPDAKFFTFWRILLLVLSRTTELCNVDMVRSSFSSLYSFGFIFSSSSPQSFHSFIQY